MAARKQMSFDLFEQPVEARLEPLAVPAPRRHEPAAYEPWPLDRVPSTNHLVTLIHRSGLVKRVRFGDVVGPRVHVLWPISNDVLEVSLRTGRVVAPRSLADWELEPNALQAARNQRK